MATQTAVQRRQLDAVAYNAFLRDCPTQKLLDRISDKWVSLVLVALAGGSQRYSELLRTMPGVSQKMLTQTLRSLERDGLVSRRVTASVPVRVDYELTELGTTLLPVMRAIKDWAECYIEDVDAARERYDSQVNASV
ncbi:winged helix-turn-helix transcriptional regulator [Pseudonocardia spinosispora]|uniref:winged helix-turn-helix transcriptional regulator n=1 Tax=Pseudonocardia spinosispora TaxID=103441 RepID=UPI00042A5CEB|nr:helix-turn-helix domain-containing protein [Pseudonocardia spinosispora]